MPNSLWRKLMALPGGSGNVIMNIPANAPIRMKRPFTIAFKETREGKELIGLEVIGQREGKGFKLSDFPGATVLNVVHKNNKITVVK